MSQDVASTGVHGGPRSERVLLINDEDASRFLVLNRVPRKNALNDALLRELSDAVREAEADARVRTIVIVGAGECFSSGRDQRDAGVGGATAAILQDGTLEQTVGIFTTVLRQLLFGSKPTIAGVRGFALAGGQALTLACDFVVAETDARFGNPEMQFGFPAAMNTVLLANHIGRRKALEIAMTGRIYSADTYASLGLVNRVVEPGSLDDELRKFARDLNALPPWAVRQTKALFRTAESCGMEEGLRAGDALNLLLRSNAQISPIAEDPRRVRMRLQAQLEAGSSS